MLSLIYLVNIINNSLGIRRYKVTIQKFNRLCINVLYSLQKMNLIDSFLISSDFCKCDIFLNTKNNTSFISKIICISKPNKYVYYSVNDLIKLRSLDLFNDYILSCNLIGYKILNIDEAIRLHTGGLLLLKIIRR